MFKVISLFAGAGGFDLGFRGDFTFLGKKYKKLDFGTVWANDFDKHACDTYTKNLGSIVHGDIVDTLKSTKLPAADIVLGGFPCQPFSHAGKREGFTTKKGILYKSMIKVVNKVRPLVFVAENVPGLLTMDNGKAIKTVVKDFEKLGYHVNYKLLNSADYGVPSLRHRVIIIGTRQDVLPIFTDDDFPTPTHDPDHWVTSGEALSDLQNKKFGSVPNHEWSKAKKNKGQGNTTIRKNWPGPTMRAEHHGNIEFHWNGKRRLSAREASRIQSFPDDFIFVPSNSAAYKQIGNAVPPLLAWNIAKAVKRFISQNISSGTHT